MHEEPLSGLKPRAALERYWDNHIEITPPQIMTLAHLARHDSVAAILAAARAARPPLVLPESLEEDGVRVVCYPGDACHPVRARAPRTPRNAETGRAARPQV